jgi:hypothetical protein
MRKSSIVTVAAVLMLVTVVAMPAAFAGGATSTTVDSVSPSVDGVEGTSTVVRNGQGVSVTYHVVGLTPGNVYSAWVSVNKFPPPAEPLAGVVVGGSGKATFAGRIAEGGLLSDPATDDVFIIIVNHGPKVPGSIRLAMTTPPFCSGGPCGPVIHAEHPAP